MSDSPIDDVVAIRINLVEARRRQAAVLAEAVHKGSDVSNWTHLHELLAVQGRIEAIDRMQADEEALAPSVYESRGVIGV